MSAGDGDDKDDERDERRERSVGDVCVPMSWWNSSVGSLTRLNSDTLSGWSPTFPWEVVGREAGMADTILDNLELSDSSWVEACVKKP